MDLNGAMFQKTWIYWLVSLFLAYLHTVNALKTDYYRGDKTRLSNQGALESNLQLFHILTSLEIYAMLIAWLGVASRYFR